MAMRTRLLLVGTLLSVAAPASAEVGFTLAARVGAGVPYGDAFQTSTGTSVALAGNTSVAIPLQMDAGIRIARRIFVGAYGEYRFSVLKSGSCPEATSCSEAGARVGGEFIYSFETSSSGPWVGLGSGWEWAFSKGTVPGATGTLTLSGWEFAQLQGGYDFWFSQVTRFGFYVSGSIAQFSQSSGAVGSGSASRSIADRTLHGWFEFGLKSTFDL
jgi:hypothetical protein